MGDLQKYSICIVGASGYPFILQKRKREKRPLFPIYVADHRAELRFLHFPLFLWANAIPMIGMLMIPKTCAYVWTVLIGYNAMKAENGKNN